MGSFKVLAFSTNINRKSKNFQGTTFLLCILKKEFSQKKLK